MLKTICGVKVQQILKKKIKIKSGKQVNVKTTIF